MNSFMRVLRVLTAALTGAAMLTLAPDPGPSAADGPYRWPLDPRPPVTHGFDPPAQRWLTGHRGVDLAAAPGTPVLAAGAGAVRFSGPVAGRPLVSVLHPDGIITTYEPVQGSVKSGDRVRRGQVIGVLQGGHRGCTAAACLHWGARRGSGSAARYLDPLALVGGVRVRLKPYSEG